MKSRKVVWSWLLQSGFREDGCAVPRTAGALQGVERFDLGEAFVIGLGVGGSGLVVVVSGLGVGATGLDEGVPVLAEGGPGLDVGVPVLAEGVPGLVVGEVGVSGLDEFRR